MALADDRFNLPGPPATAIPAAGRAFAEAVTLHKAGDLSGAMRAYARVLEIDPCHGDALNNLGVVLHAQGRDQAALAAYSRALMLQPDDPGLLCNIGNVQRALGRPELALPALHRAVELAPKAPGVQHNLGLVLRDLGHLEDALDCFERSLEIWPNNLRVRLDMAAALLALGDYRAGFETLEARHEVLGDRSPSGLPRWRGEAAAGKTLLLETENSVEDTIQFIRFAPYARSRVGRIVVACPSALRELLATAEGVDDTVAFGEEDKAEADLWLPLLSLPHLRGTTRRNLQTAMPYLRAPKEAGFALTHPDTAKLTVGILWARSAQRRDDPPRDARISDFRGLIARPDIAVYSLQTGVRAAELRETGMSGLLHDLGHLINDVGDLARVIEQLDLIVTVDTTAAQIAGALGRPAWLILPPLTDWRWMLESDYTPWYPTLHIFRQPEAGDWEGAFATVKRKLQALVAA